MKSRLRDFSAYHGGSWSPRKLSHEKECAKSSYWSPHGTNTEYQRLREVLLYKAPKRPPAIKSVEKAQFLAPVDWKKFRREMMHLKSVFKENGVKVNLLDGDPFPSPPPNLLFIRDHFFMTPYGAILGRMASSVRAGEEKWAALALARAGIPILHSIRGRGTFEGADALWIRPNLVIVGVGNRTNAEGFRQVKRLLAEFKVKCVSIQLPKEVQHLLGLLQIVGPKCAILRSSIADPKISRILRKQAYKILAVHETEEVTHRQGMNLVTLSPGRVIMADGCPELKSRLSEFGVRVVAELPISQYINAAGGIACATGILHRRAPGENLP